MKDLIIFLLCAFIAKSSLGQSNKSGLRLGKYEGIEIFFFRVQGDTSTEVDKMNERWGKKSLSLDSNGSFLLEFPVHWPRTIIGQKRIARGSWVKIKDTLILNSYYHYNDFIKVKEKKVNRNRIQVKLTYECDGKEYYPFLTVSINDKTTGITRPWTYFPLDKVKVIEIDRDFPPSDHKWVYKPVNGNSNHFVISLIDNIEGNNYVLENYKLLIVGSSLMQINRLFNLNGNCFKAKNFDEQE